MDIFAEGFFDFRVIFGSFIACGMSPPRRSPCCRSSRNGGHIPFGDFEQVNRFQTHFRAALAEFIEFDFS